MALWVPNQAEEIMLDLILAVNTQLKLHTNDVTAGLTTSQINALTEASFTEASFAGYTAKSLTGGSWTTTQGDPSTGTYAQQTFTRSSTGTAQLIYGYHVVRASDGKLLWHERLTGPVSVPNLNDTIRITPTITLEDDQEATVTARGVVGTPFSSTASSSTYTTTTTTDMVINNFDADGTRNYKVVMSAACYTTGAGTWFSKLSIDGADTARMGALTGASGNTDGYHAASYLWQPSTGQYDLAIVATELSGTASFTYFADSVDPRQFWIEDIGPR